MTRRIEFVFLALAAVYLSPQECQAQDCNIMEDCFALKDVSIAIVRRSMYKDILDALSNVHIDLSKIYGAIVMRHTAIRDFQLYALLGRTTDDIVCATIFTSQGTEAYIIVLNNWTICLPQYLETATTVTSIVRR